MLKSIKYSRFQFNSWSISIIIRSFYYTTK
nr:MAG TPA: hypothetical protein [Caudoviricetes sp.]